MKRYSFRLDNKVNTYTIYCDERALLPQEVIDLLNNAQDDDGDFVQPSYYKKGDNASPVDCFDMGLIGTDGYIGFCKGNIIKYIVRCGDKEDNSSVKDLEKALFYLNKLIQIEKFK